MQHERRRARAHAFDSVVDDYERGRPRYPAEAVEWLTGTTPTRIVDVGAGTGKLTGRLLDLGHEVVAVELSLRMAARLRQASPASVVCAVAEALPVRDGWASVVTSGQAFHWFDLFKALPEIVRVLDPDGRLAVIWNYRDERVPWVGALSDIIGSEALEDPDWQAELEESPLFGRLERRAFGFEQRLDRETLLALVRSRSNIAILGEGDRARLVEAVGRLCDEHPDLAGQDEFTLPYETVAYRINRARKRG